MRSHYEKQFAIKSVRSRWGQHCAHQGLGMSQDWPTGAGAGSRLTKDYPKTEDWRPDTNCNKIISRIFLYMKHSWHGARPFLGSPESSELYIWQNFSTNEVMDLNAPDVNVKCLLFSCTCWCSAFHHFVPFLSVKNVQCNSSTVVNWNKAECLLDAVETPMSLLHCHTLSLIELHHVVKLELSIIF